MVLVFLKINGHAKIKSLHSLKLTITHIRYLAAVCCILKGCGWVSINRYPNSHILFTAAVCLNPPPNQSSLLRQQIRRGRSILWKQSMQWFKQDSLHTRYIIYIPVYKSCFIIWKNKQKPRRAAIKVAPVQFFSPSRPCSVYLRYVSIKDKDLFISILKAFKIEI